jgi:hypothetical protein
MSYDCDCRTVAFGSIDDICGFYSLVKDCDEEFGVGAISRTQWNGFHYATVSRNSPERWEFQFWDTVIPQFPKLRFLLSRTSERDGYSKKIVRHRHDPYGFNCCLSDFTTPQIMGNFPSDRNPISVLDDFHHEILRDVALCYALNLLGYSKEMLVGCDVSHSV